MIYIKTLEGKGLIVDPKQIESIEHYSVNGEKLVTLCMGSGKVHEVSDGDAVNIVSSVTRGDPFHALSVGELFPSLSDECEGESEWGPSDEKDSEG